MTKISNCGVPKVFLRISSGNNYSNDGDRVFNFIAILSTASARVVGEPSQSKGDFAS